MAVQQKHLIIKYQIKDQKNNQSQTEINQFLATIEQQVITFGGFPNRGILTEIVLSTDSKRTKINILRLKNVCFYCLTPHDGKPLGHSDFPAFAESKITLSA